jgi:signal peptidase I
MKAFLREIVVTLAITAGIVLIMLHTIQYSVVDGVSMHPSLQDQQRVLIVKVAYLFSPPQRGDVVVLQPPFKTPKPFVKRVIGIPGDSVEIRGGQIYLNGVKLTEPYINDAPAYSMRLTIVPENNYFVLGDNRNDSTDSHYGWTVVRENIIGEVWLRVWPLNAWGVINEYPLGKDLQAAASLTGSLSE